MKRHVPASAPFIALLIVVAPAFAQHGHSAGGPPSNMGAPANAGRDSGSTGAPGESASLRGMEAQGTSAIAHSAPSDVLSHNTAIAGKISTLTGENASTACHGFKNLGECVAAAHVAKNLEIPGGFDALKKTMMGPPAENLGKAIQGFNPSADAKAEVKKANKQTADDLKEGQS